MASFINHVTRLVAAPFVASFALAGAALAEDSAPAQAALVIGIQPGGDDDAAQATIHIAEPVGTVRIGAEHAPAGQRRYADRAAAEGTGVVRFSAQAPLPPTLQVAGTMPSGSPLATGRITSLFGARANPVTGFSQHHAGIDIAASTGSPVSATGAGTVRFAGFSGNYGLLVVVDHGDGVESRYAHLSRLGVQQGQAIAKGHILGLVGSTGRSTGPHLHYELRANGRPLNPLQ